LKIGLTLHPERGMDPVFEEARQADQQGYDSIWLGDHLMNTAGETSPDRPFETFTLATGLGAATTRTRLAWAMLNVGIRPPTLLAKMLTTLDHVTHGRVIASVGSGWFKEEYEAYNLPLIDDHDERVDYACEVIQLFKELWTHPAPERVTFNGKLVRTHELPFSPAPYQKPHPPIWFGGDSEATISLVKQYCDGWVLLRTDGEDVKRLRAEPDWPTRPMTIVKTAPIFVQESRQAAEEEIAQIFESRAIRSSAPDLDAFRAISVIGTPDDCIERFREIGSTGINYIRVNCADAPHQERIAQWILPRLGEIPV
jgi:alkanesulfonate monooxygenase SsuD/methylene tetrahydromethanopterin reductase-like flavin-dependent oxidoreductase (luciferase family)